MIRKTLSSIIGLIILSVALELTMRVGSAVFTFFQNNKNQTSISKIDSNKKTITIVTLGESTTAVSANEKNTMLTQESAYPYFLEKYLNEKKLPYNFKVINKGIMGGESTTILESLESYLYSNKPDIIVAMMGMKDAIADKKTTQSKYLINRTVDFFKENSRLVQFLSNLYTQLKLKQSMKILQKQVHIFVDLSQSFLDNNQRIMGLDIGVNSRFNQQMMERDVRDLAKQEFLAIYYFRTGQIPQSEAIFKVLKKSYKFGHLLHANLLLEKNEIKKAEENLKEHLKLYPTSDFGYKELISLYINDHRIDDAKKTLNEATKNKLADSLAVKTSKAKMLKFSGAHESGIKLLEPVCGLNVVKDFVEQSKKNIIRFSQTFTEDDIFRECLYTLSEMYYAQNKFLLAEANLKRFVRNSDSISGYNLLRKTMERLGKIREAEELFQNLSTQNKRVGEYYALADFYRNHNDLGEMQAIYEDIAMSFPQTTKNYQKLYQLSKAAGAKLIIMQYPTFSLEPLIKLSGNLEGVHYISNETIFNKGPRTDYFFEPHYPYNFNHYTYLGSQTIAEHLAEEIATLLK